MPDSDPALERRAATARTLRRYRKRLARKIDALQGDLAESRRAGEWRSYGEALLAYLRQVPPRSTRVTLPDPTHPGQSFDIEMDPRVAPQVNAARYFKRAAKGQRGLKEIPPRLSAVEAEVHALDVLIGRVAALEEGASDSALTDDPEIDRDLERALDRLPAALRGRLPGRRAAARPAESLAPSARLQPRRLRTAEGWDVLVGRNNEGNDYVTHHLARPEDYWFHVHGAAGSHVVLRRGKGKNEPSKRTIEEVASWAAFFSQARTAGKVPVIVTRKKYVRKPRRGPPGLALCTNEKTVMVRPAEPPRAAAPG